MTLKIRLAGVTTLMAVTTFAIAGCSFLLPATPISGLREQDRQVVSEENGTPKEVRLTKPAQVAGLELAAGSVVKEQANDYKVQTAEQLTTRGVTFPAGSWLELVSEGEYYRWTGIVDLGGPFTQGIISAEKGDRLYFSSNQFVSPPPLLRVRLTTARAVGGKSLPADSYVDLDREGHIKDTFTPEEQKSCRQMCAALTSEGANYRCRAGCGGD
jgi:hypothetical protein